MRSVSKKNVVVKEVNRLKRVCWCSEKGRLTENQWGKVILSDESNIVVGQQSFTDLTDQLLCKCK